MFALVRNVAREIRANLGDGMGVVWIPIEIKRHFAFLVAMPAFGCAGIEVKDSFVAELRFGIAWALDLDANLPRDLKNILPSHLLVARRRVPTDIGRFDPIAGRDRTFRFRNTLQSNSQLKGNVPLSSAVVSAGRWTHDDLPARGGLYPSPVLR